MKNKIITLSVLALVSLFILTGVTSAMGMYGRSSGYGYSGMYNSNYMNSWNSQSNGYGMMNYQYKTMYGYGNMYRNEYGIMNYRYRYIMH